MSRIGQNQRCVLWVAMALAAALTLPRLGRAQEVAGRSGPATQPTAAQERAIKAGQEVAKLLPNNKLMLDPKKRAELSPQLVPALRRCLDAVAALGPHADYGRIQALAMLDLFGDTDTLAQLKKSAGGADADEAVVAKGAQLLAEWWRGNADAAAQAKTLDALRDLSKQSAADPRDHLTMVALLMMRNGPANNDMAQKLNQLISEDLPGPNAKLVAQQMAQELKAKELEEKLKEMENKPLTLAGPTVDGKTFTTADWKGKVILVDFWATWCAPCRAELPRVKKAYADFHAKGLEVLGVSCDEKADALTNFLAQNPDMPWPQLFDATQPGWHPLAKQFGIQGIPTMFLIDKKGVLRSVTARENFETQIPKLLEEKAE